VSLESGKAISTACKSLGHDVVELDPKNGIDSLFSDIEPLDLIINGLHGGDGENGVIQGFLQSIGKRFTGSQNESSAICMDKRVSKALVHRKKILTPNWISIDKEEEIPMDHGIKYPLIVKPNDQGSTIGLTIVKNDKELEGAVNLARKYTNIVLVEAFVSGREITVTIIGNKAYPIVEIMPSNDLYDYECKYTKGMTTYLCPANLTNELTLKIQNIAFNIYKLLGCRHYSRVDFILDEVLNPWFLEVNTLPGMTETSLIPKSVHASGMDFKMLIKTIIDESLKD
jgi:D-alanine-D-alanine ligase